MRSTMLSASKFGSFYSTQKDLASKTVQLDTLQQLTQCKLTLNRDRLYLLDSAGRLSCLNFRDKSVSTLNTCKLQAFHPDSWSSLSLSAISPSSELVHIHYENKQVCRVFNAYLNRLVTYQKNYLTDAVLLVEPKALVLVDGSKRIKSIKAEGNDLFVSACQLGANRFVCLLLRSGDLQIRESSTLELRNRKSLPDGISNMKVAATNCGKTIAVYGQSNQLFLLTLNDKGQIISLRQTELPFQYILQLSFSYSNALVLLGSNRVLYAVVHQEENASLKPIFNHSQKHIPTGFDISVDEKLIVLIAGRTVHMIELNKGLSQTISNASGQIIVFEDQQINENELSNKKNIQYDDEQGSEQSYQQDAREPKPEDNDEEAPPLQSVLAYKRQNEHVQNLEDLLSEQQNLKQKLRLLRAESC